MRGDSTAALYWNKHETTKRTIEGEWIRTGDAGTGRTRPVGSFTPARSDDMIKAGRHLGLAGRGRGGDPRRIRLCLSAPVIAAAGSDGLEKPHASRHGARRICGRCRCAGPRASSESFVKDRLAAYKCPRTITVVAELPKTATGKDPALSAACPMTPSRAVHRNHDRRGRGRTHRGARVIPADRRARATALVFLHEGLGSVWLRRDFPGLRRGRDWASHDCLQPERLWRLRSRPFPRPVTFGARGGQLKVFAALLDVFGGPGRRDPQAGHSDGASIALLYALGAFARRCGVSSRWRRTCSSRDLTRFGEYRASPRGLQRPPIFVIASPGITAPTSMWPSAAGNRRLASIRLSGAWNIEADDGAHHVSPLLVIQGKGDEYGTAQVESIQSRAGTSVDTLLLEACGHSPQRDQPESRRRHHRVRRPLRAALVALGPVDILVRPDAVSTRRGGGW